MEDNSFLYLTQDDIISKIDIDPRLIDSFKRVMVKMQEYYNANGYTSQRNYKEYFEKYLLNSGDKNLRLYINKIEEKGVGGFYYKEKNEICINENRLQLSKDTLDSTVCHEFTHFIVMHALMKNQADSQIINGGFINEALTEMMTQQMYPNSNAYEAHVVMQKYANLLSGQVNKYSRFLQGFIDSRWASHEWINFQDAANRFQEEFNAKGYINLAEAKNNKNFIGAQRSLINLFIEPNNKKTFEQYCDDISKLIDRPVPDQEYINQVISNMDNTMLKNLQIQNRAINDFLEKKLLEVRKLVKKSKKYNGKNVYEFEFEDRQFMLDENLVLTGSLVGMQRGWNPQTRIMTLQAGGKKLEIKVDEIDFTNREKEIQRKLAEYSSYYSKDSTKNLSMIDKAIEQSGDLLKIEKFILPMIGNSGRKTPYIIYVATYDDKIVILNNYEKIGNLSNIQLNRFIGMTHSNPNRAAIYSEKLGTIENGVLFTTLNEKQLKNRAILEYSREISKTITADELIVAIEKYKSSDFYSQSYTEEFIKNEALILIAEDKFNSLNDETKLKFIEIAKENSDRFIVTAKGGKVDVAAIHGSEIITAYNSERQVLYDFEGQGIYNEIYEELRKNKGDTKLNDRIPIQIDKKGNILIERKVDDFDIELINQEKFNQITKQVEELKIQYGCVATQIENLMIENSKTPIPNYQEQLNKLMAQRDSISKQMRIPMTLQREYQNIIDEEKRIKHKNVISQVERLLGIHITPIAGCVYDNNLKMLRQILKDTNTLRQEHGTINKQLNQLFDDGKLDLKTYNEMKIEIIKEFNEMISKVPKQSTGYNSKFEQEYEQQSQTQQQPVQYKVEEVDNFVSELRKKYFYDTMTDEEKKEFDEKVERIMEEDLEKVEEVKYHHRRFM